MKTEDFFYNLPPELIAQHPLADRLSARMMVVDRRDGGIQHRHVRDLPEFLSDNDLMVVNDTKVIPARIFGKRRDTDGRVELLLLEKIEGGSDGTEKWTSFYRASGKPAEGLELDLCDGKIKGEILSLSGEGRIVVGLVADGRVSDVLNRKGQMPLPPYIKRKVGGLESDREDYQTVFADMPGAVAAPTAGLHFTDELLEKIDEVGVARVSVTLHVGPGTFIPVKTEHVADHRMEKERYVVGSKTAEAVSSALREGRRVVAVGSTTVRVLESMVLSEGTIQACEGETSIFIYPPFTFRIVGAMLTNFHLAGSTLLMMVSAFASRELIMRAYAEAIDKKYRFYSYGDCMLIL